jgi:predicted ATPase
MTHGDAQPLDAADALARALRAYSDLLNCRAVLRAARYELMLPKFNIALAQGHAALGRFAEAITIIEETVRLVEVSGALTHMPELLRVKGSILVSMPQPSVDDAEACFLQSLGWGRQQNALAWELRTAIDLAALWVSQNRAGAAQGLLEPIFGRFLEGFETADLKAAERLLTKLARIAS